MESSTEKERTEFRCIDGISWRESWDKLNANLTSSSGVAHHLGPSSSMSSKPGVGAIHLNRPRNDENGHSEEELESEIRGAIVRRAEAMVPSQPFRAFRALQDCNT